MSAGTRSAGAATAAGAGTVLGVGTGAAATAWHALSSTWANAAGAVTHMPWSPSRSKVTARGIAAASRRWRLVGTIRSRVVTTTAVGTRTWLIQSSEVNSHTAS